ncbi:hypothetical protein L198_08062 [Cryptococcus wingfieldii CBS 7118]|uniref:Uncharacterized protein n=1 Tax=Cryptococcus wingfieldii CBS 7118 TaxID=1295528 RepID=A0A1E3HJD7_9TREE|nr:hypothetical protein L198_08062 [Cryptococcus wingfieldii CBS 7118]ODN76467.1 hypothetical protein L198_08062 [Cryptococcus wingfieldii CBS 7118]
MADHTVIVQFKKASSPEDRKKAISELTSKGAKIVSDENADSTSMSPSHIKSNRLGGKGKNES